MALSEFSGVMKTEVNSSDEGVRLQSPPAPRDRGCKEKHLV